jgi:hypothetical protein
MPGPDLEAEVTQLRQRMDCFYSWATQLQHEIRELQRRTSQLEGASANEEAALLRRVGALKP